MASPLVLAWDNQKSTLTSAHRWCIHTPRYAPLRDLNPAFDFGRRACGICGQPLQPPSEHPRPTTLTRPEQLATQRGPRGRTTVPGDALTARPRHQVATPVRNRLPPARVEESSIVFAYDNRRDDVLPAHRPCAQPPCYRVLRDVDPTISFRHLTCEICGKPLTTSATGRLGAGGPA